MQQHNGDRQKHTYRKCNSVYMKHRCREDKQFFLTFRAKCSYNLTTCKKKNEDVQLEGGL